MGTKVVTRMAITTATITNTMQHPQHGQTLAGRTLERVSRPMLLRVRIRQAMAQLTSRIGRVRSVSVDFASTEPARQEMRTQTWLQRRFPLVKLVSTQLVDGALVSGSFCDEISKLRVFFRRPSHEQRPGPRGWMRKKQGGEHVVRKLVGAQNELPLKWSLGRAVETAVPDAGIAGGRACSRITKHTGNRLKSYKTSEMRMLVALINAYHSRSGCFRAS
jgi:hypothetical protein